jgi:hypothetical protein
LKRCQGGVTEAQVRPGKGVLHVLPVLVQAPGAEDSLLEPDQDSFPIELGVPVHFGLKLRGIASVSPGVERNLRKPVEGSGPVDLELLGELPAGGGQDGVGSNEHQEDGQDAQDAEDTELHAGSASMR